MLNNITQSKITLIIILSLIFSISFASAVLAAEAESADNYVLTADDITFLQAEGLVLFEGNAVFKASDFVVESNKITVDTNTKIIKASGNVVIHSEKDDLYGDSLTYNYESEKGELFGAEGSIGEINFSGKILKILSVSPVAAEIESAEFTPCIREEPHYHFKAEQIKINDDNSLDIFGIAPYIANIQVFYLPYYSVEYDPSDGESPLKNAFPFPKLGYDNDRGLTAEFKYPYQIGDKSSGEIFYLTEGREYDRYEERIITNFYQLTDYLTIKNRYDYLYNYDLDDEELDDFEEEFFSSILYDRGKYALEAGVGRDLRAEDNENRYLLAGHYNFTNGLNTSFRQEYDFDEQRVKEKYLMSYNQYSINWNLKYIAGESYNYYPYLTLNFPRVLGIKTTIGSGRVENEGVELNKERVSLGYNLKEPLAKGLNYHLAYNYRLDHYRSSYDYNYYYTRLNTGFSYNTSLNQKMNLILLFSLRKITPGVKVH